MLLPRKILLIALWMAATSCLVTGFAPNSYQQTAVVFQSVTAATRGGREPSPQQTTTTIATTHLYCQQRDADSMQTSNNKRWSRLFNPVQGIENVMTAGPLARIKNLKKAHNPITYIAMALLAGFRWEWCFRNPYYWFAVAFCVKWYRAKYVFKIPVWDRQPNWNNIITSKEQEKDLKAYTCKNCGSTLFIAKTREFFFEGGTGIGGLGCFSCGAKGADNFVMDRDRIVEDVADEDDYFDYERPLDFVSRAERRKIMKEAGGDEDRANQLLAARANEPSGAEPVESKVVDAEIVTEEAQTEEVEDVVVEGEEEETTTSVDSVPEPIAEKTKEESDDLGALDMDF